MRQTTCQNCKAANKASAVVCFNCGTKLAHEERRLISRLRNRGILERIYTAPVRLAKYLFRKIKIVVSLFLVLFFLGVVLGIFMFHLPTNWPKYEEPRLGEEDQKRLESLFDAFAVPAAKDATLMMNLSFATAIGNRLLYLPAPGSKEAKDGVLLRAGDEKRPIFYASKRRGDHYIFMLSGEYRDKIPWRLAVECTVSREAGGAISVERYAYGNMSIPESLFFKLLDRFCRELNPNEKLTAAVRRIEAGRMPITHNHDDTNFEVTLKGDPEAAAAAKGKKRR